MWRPSVRVGQLYEQLYGTIGRHVVHRSILNEQSEHGCLGYHTWFGRTVVCVQYWNSMEALLSYAWNVDASHVRGWRSFIRRIGDKRDVGVWHEAYVTHPSGVDVIYRNMPAFGMGKATTLVRPGGHEPGERAAGEPGEGSTRDEGGDADGIAG
ncbi:protein of unknown function [Amycolatopsis arida]|uniref:DUF4188 domain-containing protein n=1 Tax=Amycolatopsis arida TaxID=587909 RepID=A0A1I5M8H8_9PSEU|nr:uncharacterized protein DUF4188 [Amycolatopsis arida]SFP05825.1 protein of unknown function [Amycolatopsis arida]